LFEIDTKRPPSFSAASSSSCARRDSNPRSQPSEQPLETRSKCSKYKVLVTSASIHFSAVRYIIEYTLHPRKADGMTFDNPNFDELREMTPPRTAEEAERADARRRLAFEEWRRSARAELAESHAILEGILARLEAREQRYAESVRKQNEEMQAASERALRWSAERRRKRAEKAARKKA
jgi:hypothetical protein